MKSSNSPNRIEWSGNRSGIYWNARENRSIVWISCIKSRWNKRSTFHIAQLYRDHFQLFHFELGRRIFRSANSYFVCVAKLLFMTKWHCIKMHRFKFNVSFTVFQDYHSMWKVGLGTFSLLFSNPLDHMQRVLLLLTSFVFSSGPAGSWHQWQTILQETCINWMWTNLQKKISLKFNGDSAIFPSDYLMPNS